MEGPAYASTTESMTPKPNSRFGLLGSVELLLKVAQVILSFIAFVLEEVLTICHSCAVLYLFEFFSCTAFLFTLLLLILIGSPLHKKVGINTWHLLDFWYTLGIAFLFLVASAIFLSDNGGTALETVAGVFGVLASLAFGGNVIYLVKTKGIGEFISCQKSKDPPQAQPPTVEAGQPETEKLTNGQDGNA